MRRLAPFLLIAGLVAGCSAAPPEPLPGPPVPPTAAPTSAPAGRAVPVYYVAQTPAGPRLQREFHRVATDDPASAAVREMLAAPTGGDPDYRNPWPAGTVLKAPVTHTGGTITVDLSAAAPSDIAAQQLAFTVQGASGSTDPVLLNGKRVARGDPYALRNLVQLDTPGQGTSSATPLVVTGEAAVFEATLPWTVLRDGTTVRSGVTSTAQGQVFAPFRFTVDLPPGTYVIRISEDDPSGGAGRPVLTDDRTVTIS